MTFRDGVSTCRAMGPAGRSWHRLHEPRLCRCEDDVHACFAVRCQYWDLRTPFWLARVCAAARRARPVTAVPRKTAMVSLSSTPLRFLPRNNYGYRYFRPVFFEAGHDFDEIARPVAHVELPFQDVVPAVLHCTRRAGQGKEIGAARNAGAGARLDVSTCQLFAC